MNELVKLDQENRRLALNPRQSFIVQAPAGSGKTELIIQRILSLLAQVKKPEEILAITFTKKSAHEMRTRVLKALDSASKLPEPEKEHEKLTWQLATAVLERDKELQWHLIENPNQLSIKTIDAFCSYLTGQLPLLSHFGSQPDIATYAYSLYREAVLEVLSHVEESHSWSTAIGRLLTHTDNDTEKLAALLINMLQKRDQWRDILFANHDMTDSKRRELLTEYIASVITLQLEQIDAIFPHELSEELLSLLRFSADYLSRTDKENRIAALIDITEMPGTIASDINIWQGIAEFVLTKEGEWRRQVHKNIGFPPLNTLTKAEEPEHRDLRKRHKELIEAMSVNDELLTSLQSVRKLPPPGYTNTQWDILKDLLEVLKISLAQLRVTFQLHGQIDFIENASAALQALGTESNPTDLALSLDYQIKHILVDEFQDTSSTQYWLLEKLTYGWQPDDGRTLFVVGDPMQSIYRFRQADVSLFIRMQTEGIGGLKLIPLSLAVNFRSTPQIVDWNNQQFSAIFPVHDDISTGAVKYSFSSANQSLSDAPASTITMRGFIDGNEQAQSAAVINFINETLVTYPNEKIAILVRSRPHLAAIIPALKAAGLNYNALEIDPLMTRPSIQDCLVLTRALIHPADRIAWLSLLRAPWCGLTISDLLELCRHDRHAIIYELLHNNSTLQRISPDGQQRINRILPILESAINNRDRSGFREWIENSWQALGGPATLNEYNEIADINEYFDLISELTANGTEINLEILNERICELRASTHHDDALIQIMTVHSAKGLEFDTVILPHLEKSNAKDDPSLLLWMDQPLYNDKIALLLAPIHASGSDKDALYAYIESIQKTKSQYETDRLFYVAATRAKKRLHLVFNIKDKEKATISGSFLDKLWPLIANKTHLIKPDSIASPEAMPNQPEQVINRLTTEWKNPIQIHLSEEQSSFQSKKGFQLPDHTPRLIGTTAHRIFQLISIQGISWWQNQSANAQFNYLSRHLLQAGIASNRLKSAVSEISAIITRAINDDRFQWIISTHSQARSEYQLTITNEARYENIIIDRTFVADNVRWIIDYKTAENQDDDLQIFLEKQKEKHREQMQKYSEAIKNIDTNPVKIGLYFPTIPAWCEW
ncbi:MAG TPA: UvrD-helicase domain-containing protein [Gammaproteobacteria bacterium]|nr:UvrD-helicase domain-containing protein [Gammaproteobacteria bacterium]